MPLHTCRSQRTTFRSPFDSSIMWVQEMELWSSGLVARALTHWAISPVWSFRFENEHGNRKDVEDSQCYIMELSYVPSLKSHFEQQMTGEVTLYDFRSFVPKGQAASIWFLETIYWSPEWPMKCPSTRRLPCWSGRMELHCLTIPPEPTFQRSQPWLQTCEKPWRTDLPHEYGKATGHSCN